MYIVDVLEQFDKNFYRNFFEVYCIIVFLASVIAYSLEFRSYVGYTVAFLAAGFIWYLGDNVQYTLLAITWFGCYFWDSEYKYKLMERYKNTIFAKLNEQIVTQMQEIRPGNEYIYSRFVSALTYTLVFTNLSGLMPLFWTLTCHLIFVLYFSMCFFLSNMIISVRKHGFNFFHYFVPGDVPLTLIWLLLLIEYISYFSKVASLAIRLFANLVAGHILGKIIIVFVYVGFELCGACTAPEMITIVIVFIILSLELFITLLQTYVFNLLVIIYISDLINLH